MYARVRAKRVKERERERERKRERREREEREREREREKERERGIMPYKRYLASASAPHQNDGRQVAAGLYSRQGCRWGALVVA